QAGRSPEKPAGSENLGWHRAVLEDIAQLVQLTPLLHAAQDLHGYRRGLPGSTEVSRQPVVLGGVTVAPAGPGRDRVIERLIGTSHPAGDHRGQRLDLAEGVGDPLARSRV